MRREMSFLNSKPMMNRFLRHFFGNRNLYLQYFNLVLFYFYFFDISKYYYVPI